MTQAATAAATARGPTERGPTERGPTERGPLTWAGVVALVARNPGFTAAELVRFTAQGQLEGHRREAARLALVPLLHWACGQGLLINGRARRCQVSGCETQTWHPALQLGSTPGRGRGRPDPAAADLTGPLVAEFPEALA